MSDYVPSTQEIAEHWSRVPGQDVDPEAAKRNQEREAAFYRWLGEHDAEVRKSAPPSEYTVELGGQFLTKKQWEAVQVYRSGRVLSPGQESS